MRPTRNIASLASFALVACGGGGSGGGASGVTAPAPTPAPSSGGAYAVSAAEELSVADVQRVLAEAAAQARADSTPAVVAVTDRVGNVLGVLRMTGAPATAQISHAPNGADIDVQGAVVPAEAAAIAKAITGAYLSSGGNAFSSRTASMIVQQHFPPAPSTAGLESGPLFGVQFSQLPCSDLMTRAVDGPIGPQRSPLGLAADPGGFPLYKNGVLVGGVGVMADGQYGFDPNVLDVDADRDEKIALAGTVGFEAPIAIRADRIYVDGTQLRFSDVDYPALTSLAGASFAATVPALGALVPYPGYYPGGGVAAGTAYGSETSGIRPARAVEFPNADAFVLSDGAGNDRFPVRGATDAAEVAQPLTAAEVRAALVQAFAVMTRARAQIRQPLDSRAQVSISVVDTRGQALGVVRSPDAPIFGTDVSLQKARTAAFFSLPRAGAELSADPSADVRQFVPAFRTFLADPGALTGRIAFTDRAIGNLARPYFPDGQLGTPNGPLSRPIAQFNPFSTGLQSALVAGNIVQGLQFSTGASATDAPRRCSAQARLANGIQIFPGSVPIYRGATLVGGIGVSGDGIDQDDMISFLGLSNAGVALGGFGNAPFAIRSDTVVVPFGSNGVRLRYVGCPFAPFLDTSQQNVCQGL